MADMEDFLRMLMEGAENSELPDDVAEQLSNKRAATKLIRQELENEYTNLQADLMDERFALDKMEIEANLAKERFKKLRNDLFGGVLALSVIAGVYLTVVFSIWATQQL